VWFRIVFSGFLWIGWWRELQLAAEPEGTAGKLKLAPSIALTSRFTLLFMLAVLE